MAPPALAQGGRVEVPQAEDAPLHRLLGAEDLAPWAAVGRVNLPGGFCTGTLIAPDLVLTAAHCLYFPRSGRLVPADELHFLPGYRRGAFRAHARVARYVQHPGFRYGAPGAGLATDLALLELVAPVPPGAARPLLPGPPPGPGEAVILVSYARERAHVPAVQDPCHVRALDHERAGRRVLLSCEANFGASGAPVLVRSGGRLHVGAIVPAMVRTETGRAAVGIGLGALGRLLGVLGR